MLREVPARKPTLSPSKLTTYLACPSKYKWTYIDERGKWYLRSKSYFSFGSTLHKVLQRFHDSQDSGVTTTHEAVAALEESWISAGYQSAQEMQEAMSEGKAIVETYIEDAIQTPSDAVTLFVEKQLRVDLGPFVLLGRLDRVDEYADGTLEVIDYKSGRKGVTAEDVETDLAMTCYQLMLREKFPDRPVRASILALRSNTRATVALSEDQLIEFRRDLIALGEEILNRNYEELDPVGKVLCHTCDFLPLCRSYPDFTLPELNPES